MPSRRKYLFKALQLSESERLWLTEIYKQGLTKIDVRSLRIKLRHALPRDFRPKSLEETNLIYSGHISLLGIWHIDPGSKYIKASEVLIQTLQGMLLSNDKMQSVDAAEASQRTGIDPETTEIAFMLIFDLPGFWGGASADAGSRGFTSIRFSASDDSVVRLIHFQSIEDELEEFYLHSQAGSSPRGAPALPVTTKENSRDKDFYMSIAKKEIWAKIRDEFGITKPTFGKKINFVTNAAGRIALFRDVEHAYILAKNGFSKPAIILAGGVIEELLRLYLHGKNIRTAKNTFDGYIRACEEADVLKSAIGRLSDSVRHFRNLVHIEKEIDEQQRISRAMAQNAVASIFTIADALG